MLTNIFDPLINKNMINHIDDYNKIFLCHRKLLNITSYCLISHPKCNLLSISFYIEKSKNRVSHITFKAKSSEVLCSLIISHNKIANDLCTGHALYIGMELMKAELTMITGQSYTQN